MAAEQPNRRLVWTLGAALVGALLVIAFLLGRETGREASVEGAEPEPTSTPEPATVGSSEPTQRSRWAVEPTRDPGRYRYPEPTAAESGWIEKRPDGRIVISNTRPTTTPKPEPSDLWAPEPPPAASSPRDADDEVASYFQKVSLVRSEAGAGDPSSFAMGLIKSGLGGSTAGFDRLVADSERMERELRSITPPPDCQEFHDANLDTMAESREMLESMRDAIVERDIQKLNRLARDAADLQARAEALARMQEDLLASAASR